MKSSSSYFNKSLHVTTYGSILSILLYLYYKNQWNNKNKNKNISNHNSKTSICNHNNNESQLNRIDSYPIDYTMHQENREKLIKRFHALNININHSVILLHGGTEINKYDTDTQYIFRQESFFHYLFGVKEPGFMGCIDLNNNKSILFMPKLSNEWEIWSGKRKSKNYFMNLYKVDEIYYTDEIHDVLQKKEIKKIYILNGKNLDSGLETALQCSFNGMDSYDIDKSILYNELVECRVIKTEKELSILRYINNISSKAHIEVMKNIKPNMNEYHSEAIFLYYCYFYGGARFHAYTCICGSGINAATLHYGHAGAPNNKKLDKNDFFLNDMGAEYHCYASDITVTFPINGLFNEKQKQIYESVLKAHDIVINTIKEGVHYMDMHLLSHKILTEQLMKIGLLINGTVEELMHYEISTYFYPHGLGHLMGLDVHDVGGYEKNQKKSTKRILKNLRLSRILKKDMVLTVEPGCYFIDALIEECLTNPITSKYINKFMLKEFRGFGGVRIESNIIVLENGAENMTKVPRKIKDIQICMATL